MYAGAPLALGALRHQKPDLPRPYRLPYGSVLAPLAFVLATFIVYWAGWGTYSTLLIAMLIGFALIAISYIFGLNANRPHIDWAAAIWVFPYLIGLGVISFFGQFGASGTTESSGILDGVGIFKNVLVGGKGEIPLYLDLGVLNLGLSSGSKAVDLYQGSAPVPATDIDGTHRPQGGHPDAGAFEVKAP
ncbi:MAG: choice-of-anchor Q domain-containing protein [Solirubrobacteraceae bacterium]